MTNPYTNTVDELNLQKAKEKAKPKVLSTPNQIGSSPLAVSSTQKPAT